MELSHFPNPAFPATFRRFRTHKASKPMAHDHGYTYSYLIDEMRPSAVLDLRSIVGRSINESLNDSFSSTASNLMDGAAI